MTSNDNIDGWRLCKIGKKLVAETPETAQTATARSHPLLHLGQLFVIRNDVCNFNRSRLIVNTQLAGCQS